MVSVVMAIYNGEKYILEQLESIRLQTRIPDEVILMDDCSTDHTAEVVRGYLKEKELNWIFIQSEENKGYIANFTEALRYANGDIIFLADQDDIWEKNKIAWMERKLIEDNRILALNTGFECIDGESKHLPARNPIFTSNHGLMICKNVRKNSLVKIKPDYNLCYNISMGCTMAFRKELLDDFYRTEALSLLPHDWKLNLLAALKGGLFFWNVPCIRYRIHTENTTGIKTDYNLSVDYRVGVYQKYLVYYKQFKEMLNVLSYYTPKLIKQCDVLHKFYEERIHALEGRKMICTIGIAIRYFPYLGVKSLPVMMDIFSMRAKR